MRKNKFLLISVAILSGCSLSFNESETQEYFVNEVTHHNYFEVENKAISWDNILNVPLENYYVYFYSPSCSHCADLKDWIIEKCLELDNIFIVKSSEKDVIGKNVTSSIGATSVSNIMILGYPSLIQVVNHVIYKNVAGKTKIQQLLNT